MKKIAILLAGCGVFDGSEIHESTFAMLAVAQNNASFQCFAPDKDQFHVINHLNGKEQSESRNVLVESARIARGEVKDLKEYKAQNFDALIIPGGFGAAKNLNQWAIKGPEGELDGDVKNAIKATHLAQKYIVGLCMGPTVISQALSTSVENLRLTVGTDKEESPYDILGISQGMESLGSRVVMKSKLEFLDDEDNKVISAPCYMMEANIAEVYQNILNTVNHLFKKI